MQFFFVPTSIKKKTPSHISLFLQEHAALDEKSKLIFKELRILRSKLVRKIFKLAKHKCKAAFASCKIQKLDRLDNEFLGCEGFIQLARHHLQNYQLITQSSEFAEVPGITSFEAGNYHPLDSTDAFLEELCFYAKNHTQDSADFEKLEDTSLLFDPTTSGLNQGSVFDSKSHVSELPSQTYILSPDSQRNEDLCANTGEIMSQAFVSSEIIPGDPNLIEEEPDLMEILGLNRKTPPSYVFNNANLDPPIEVQYNTFASYVETDSEHSTVSPLQQKKTNSQDLGAQLNHHSSLCTTPLQNDKISSSGCLLSPSAVWSTSFSNQDIISDVIKQTQGDALVASNKSQDAFETSCNDSRLNSKQDFKSTSDMISFKLGSSKLDGKGEDSSYLEVTEEDFSDIIDLKQVKEDKALKEEMHQHYVHKTLSPVPDSQMSLLLTYKANQPGQCIEKLPDSLAMDSHNIFSKDWIHASESERESYDWLTPSLEDFLAF